MSARTYVDESRFIFASDVTVDGYRHTIVVHWAGQTIDVSALPVVRGFANVRPEASEVWFVFPADLESAHRKFHSLELFRQRTDWESEYVFRFFAVQVNGAWIELLDLQVANAGDPAVIDEAGVDLILQDGLRQLFRDADSLASASAGYHFARGARRHSERFIRSSQAVSRAQHAFFVAAALLAQTNLQTDSRLFADTAGIAPALHALVDLARRLGLTDADLLVDSFGSYEGYARNLKLRGSGDWVFISSSTSGSLAHEVIKKAKASPDRVVTLYYLSEALPDPDLGLVLCDLTNRDKPAIRSVRDARVAPYDSYPIPGEEGCKFCQGGSRPIELTGDSFFPKPDGLKLRMPGLKDRPLNGQSERPLPLLTKFDNSGYFEDLYGLGVIRASPQVGLETRLDGAFYGDLAALGARTKLIELAESLITDKTTGKKLQVAAIAGLPDDDSKLLVGFLADHFLDSPTQVVPEFTVESRFARAGMKLDEIGAALPPGSAVIACAGVLASGRALLRLNRQLRILPDSIETRYLVGVVHPESAEAFDIFQKTIGLKSSSGTNRLVHGWKLPREPRPPKYQGAWAREELLLGEVEGYLADNPQMFDLAEQVRRRLAELNAPALERLFVASTFGGADERRMTPINPKFALWPFEWSDDPRAAVSGPPTEAEALATIGHFLYESRRLSPVIESGGVTVLLHGYALNPAIFDRYNEPQLQAAILRSAEPGELHYVSNRSASRAMADVLEHALTHSKEPGGESAYEFLLAVALGELQPDGAGMRIDPKFLRPVLDRALARPSNPALIQSLLLWLTKS